MLAEQFDPQLVDRATVELEERRVDDFLLELTVLAHGTKTEQPSHPIRRPDAPSSDTGALST